ncbi:DinB family protein [Chamaesiphon sp. VAR_48_metabat_135_sub]|uniref:DinB family protein n=1 Tax=Chamaesiphon sp. VAR_48_metabat_135_sub TaxID=2964699 RepID=UPI00286C40AA|nr:DinB family protein [Chamaesiphon sp. VAR_48_metabat_135_sub]
MNYYTVMATYNQWINQKLYDICTSIPDVDRKSDRGAFFKSIDGTLNHILVGDLIWLGRFTQQPFVGKLDGGIYSNFSELWAERERLDFPRKGYANELLSIGCKI